MNDEDAKRKIAESSELATLWIEFAQKRGYTVGHCGVAATIIRHNVLEMARETDGEISQ